MQSVIEEIIRKKHHLADPLRFYQKNLRFREAVEKLPLTVSGSRTAYDPELIQDIFSRFSSLLELPEGSLSPLKQAMELREIDFTRLPFGEIPAFSLPYDEEDLGMLLYLLSKPWFSARGKACQLSGRTWEEGKCPVCNAQPTVTWIGEDGRRHASCSFCNTEGYVNRAGCPICLVLDAQQQKVLVFEGEEGFSLHTCDLCRSYTKTIDAALIGRWSPEIADLVSLPLDIVVQEQGYQRRSPNPIGMRTITTRG